MATTTAKASGGAKKGKGGGARKPAPATAERDPLLLANGQTRLDLACARFVLGAFGVSLKAGATDADLATALRAAVGEKIAAAKDDEKLKCDDCGEVSTTATEFCPYCGEGATDEQRAEFAKAPMPVAAAPTNGKASGKGKAAPAAAESTEEALAALSTELDASLQRISVLRGDLAGNAWEIGSELKKIHDRELWKARGRTSFKEFLEKDTTVSRSWAYKLMDIVAEFDRETFLKVGASKLNLLTTGAAGADPEAQRARAAALEKAHSGSSKRDVATAVGKNGGQRKAPEKADREAAPPRGPQDITLLTKVGSKAQLLEFRSASSGRPIKKHADDAYAELKLSEDVRLLLGLKINADGEILGVTAKFERAE